MMKRMLVMILLVGMVISLYYAGGDAQGKEVGIGILTNHEPMRLNNDSDLQSIAQSEGWRGDGSAANPYVIENYDIDANGGRAGIYLGNITMYVVIRNCTIHNVSEITNYGWGAGIAIYNTPNVVIDNVTAYDVVQYGVYIGRFSDHAVVENSHFYPGNKSYVAGITVSSGYATIRNNTVIQSAVGLWLFSAYYSKIYSNTLVGSSIRIDYGYSADSYDIPSNNTVNGKPVIYVTGFRNNQTIDASNAGEVIIGGASWLTVRNLRVNNTGSSILLLGSRNITIEDSIVENFTTTTVISHLSENITLRNITLIGSGAEGIRIYGTKDFLIDKAKISGKTFNDGIYINSCQGVWINNTEISGASYGIYLYGNLSGDIALTNSSVHNFTSYGFYANSGSTNDPIERILVERNTFFNSAYDSIYFNTVTNTVIRNNTLLSNPTDPGSNAIHLAAFTDYTVVEGNYIDGDSTGIYLGSVYHTTIRNNIVLNNAHYGISIYTSSYNSIHGNRINSSGIYGIIFGTSSRYNEIFENKIGNSSSYGMYFQSGTVGNRVYNNSFYFNHGSNDTYNSSRVQAYDSGINYWNTTSNGGNGYGNFWYDWTTPDGDGDGIVDNPYLIDGNTGAKDNFPLATPSQIPEFSPGLMAVIVAIATIVFIWKRR